MMFPDSSDSAASKRIDPSHVREEPPAETPIRRRRAKSTPQAVEVAAVKASVAAGEATPTADASPPVFRPEPADAVPEIVVHHAHDLALHLAERLREVERRELAAAEYESKLQEAEAAARVWVCQRDIELTSLERELQLKSDELKTQSAAIAAAEIAAEEEIRNRQATQQRQEMELERTAAQLAEREEQLHAQQAALDRAVDKLRADRRRDEELHRSRQQKWHALLEADRAQAERIAANLHKHRLALDERERALHGRELAAARAFSGAEARRAEPENSTELSVLRAQAARDHRLALEHRWIAGQLWARLTASGLAGDEELQSSLEQVRNQLELLYHREREALEELQASLAETFRQATPMLRERRPAKPRVLAFTA